MKTVSKYFVYMMILVTFFIVVSGCSINQSFSDKQNTNKTIRVVAVGDNLIHPVVYIKMHKLRGIVLILNLCINQ